MNFKENLIRIYKFVGFVVSQPLLGSVVFLAALLYSNPQPTLPDQVHFWRTETSFQKIKKRTSSLYPDYLLVTQDLFPLLFGCGTRPYKWGTQWDSNSLPHPRKNPSKLLNVLWRKKQEGTTHICKNDVNTSLKNINLLVDLFIRNTYFPLSLDHQKKNIYIYIYIYIYLWIVFRSYFKQVKAHLFTSS